MRAFRTQAAMLDGAVILAARGVAALARLARLRHHIERAARSGHSAS